MSKPNITVVTGGSSGIGAACVRHLAKRGDHVISLDLPGTWSEEKMRAMGVTAYACNVTDDDGMRETAAMIEAKHGPVTALVNSAGILQNRLSPDLLTMTEWDRVVDIDQRGTYLACAIYGSRMVELGGGAIVNIASIVGMRAVGQLSSYGMSKAGMIQMTHSMAREWGRYGINTNAIAPGYIATDISADFLATEAGAKWVGALPRRRMGRAEDLDALLLLLCAGEAARFINGSVMVADDGFTSM